MRGFLGVLSGGILAMAGKRSPWGGGSNGGGDEPVPEGEASGGDDAPADPPGDKPARGPRNPWLPGGNDDAAPPRRSASIEDIFRNRSGRGRGSGDGSGGGSGGGPRFPRRADGRSWAPTIIGLLALAWIGLSSVHLLGQKEQGIVTTFGKYSRTLGSGVALTLPWPIQSVTKRDVTTFIQTNLPSTEGENLILTSDKNLVDISYQIRWKIKDLRAFTFEVVDPAATVAEVAEAAMRSSVAEMPLSAVWGGSGRGELQDNVRRRMQVMLDAYRSGVQVLGVEVKKADPPAKVADAFQEVNNAQQDAQKFISQSQGWAQEKIAVAEGDASAFNQVYEQYRLAPEVTRRRLYYETMERVLSNNEKVITGGNGITPYLPLPEVRRRAAPAPQATPGGQ
jgi:modulator of FtsH protease HflK